MGAPLINSIKDVTGHTEHGISDTVQNETTVTKVMNDTIQREEMQVKVREYS